MYHINCNTTKEYRKRHKSSCKKIKKIVILTYGKELTIYTKYG